MRTTRNRLRTVESARCFSPAGLTRIPASLPAIFEAWSRALAGKPAAQSGARGIGQALGRAEECHSRPDRARMADGPEAVDRAYSRNDSDGAHAREHRRGRSSIPIDRTCRTECSCFGYRGPRGPATGNGACSLRSRSSAEEIGRRRLLRLLPPALPIGSTTE